MLIGIDASRANKKNKTGVEWYSYHVIQELKKIDQKNQYFLYTREKLEGDLADCPPNFKEVILKWPPKYLWTQFRLSWEMKFGKFKPEVLFISAHVLPLWHPKKSVVTIHDVGFCHFPKLYNWKDKLYHLWSTGFIALMSKKIITISEFSKTEIEKYFPKSQGKIEVIPIGFDSTAYRVIENQELLKATLNKFKITKPFFLDVARLEYKKNILGLLEAFDIFRKKFDPEKKYQLVLVGNPANGYDKIKAKISELGLENDVIEIGWTEKPDMVNLYNSAEIFIFPSFYEGFGIPPLEAMACGTPVITSNIASLPEVVGQSAITVDPYQPEIIAQAMNYILTKPELKAKLIQNGFDQIKKFSWQRCAQETLKVFENL
ncbi:MAG: glycosyltransferase family 1 protein [Patescibacteria group bacterium]